MFFGVTNILDMRFLIKTLKIIEVLSVFFREQRIKLK